MHQFSAAGTGDGDGLLRRSLTLHSGSRYEKKTSLDLDFWCRQLSGRSKERRDF